MIDVLLGRTESGALVFCMAEGHAGYAAKGFDIVCSAVSVLLKTTLNVLEKNCGLELETDASKRGFVSFRVKNPILDSELEERLVYAGDFLAAGLESVAGEYPRNLKLQYTTV